MKVSVIVPVYNGEGHLKQCMDSICSQTLQEIEIICVDDGSTDSSLQILQDHQKQDGRIRLYRQQHKNAGAARNLGKKHATGEYLIFWDCDDFFELNALKELYNKASSLRADICVCGANRYHEARKKLEPKRNGYLQKKRLPAQEVFNRVSNEDYILNFTTLAAWNKIFRREFIESIGLNFQEIRNGNDVYFTVNALCLAERITTLDKALVTYRVNDNKGLVGTISQAPLSPIKTWLDAVENLEKLDAFPEQSFANKALGSMIYVLRNQQIYDAFVQVVECLQAGALEKMGITANRENGFYYSSWHEEVVEHLTEDTPQQFLAYFSHVNYKQMVDRYVDNRVTSQRLNAANAKAKKDAQKYQGDIKNYQDEIENYQSEIKEFESEIEDYESKIKSYQRQLKQIKSSYSFRVGKAVTWLPRKVKRLSRGSGCDAASTDVKATS